MTALQTPRSATTPGSTAHRRCLTIALADTGNCNLFAPLKLYLSGNEGGIKLLLFLGAGVSVPSGLPTAANLTDRILHGAYHHEGKGIYAPGRHSDPLLRADDLTCRIQRFLRLLNKHDTRDIKRVGYYPVRRGFRSSGAIFRSSTTYEDIFFLCQQISLWNIGLSDNSLTTPFMEYIERRAQGLLSGRSIKARMSDLATLGQRACYFIESVVAETLRQEYRAGFDRILELAISPQIEQLNIITLNHDTLVEQFLAAKRVEFVDGFGERDGDVRWSNDHVYDGPDVHVRLLKLHGSINWYSFGDSASRTAILSGVHLEAIKDGKGRLLEPMLRRPSFLSGINKATAYQRGIYADIHFRFHELLRSCDHMVMSGYGWGDTAINFQLDSWLDRCRRNTIVLLHENPEQLVEKSLVLASAYDGRVRSGQLVCIKSWPSDVSLLELQRHLLS